MKIALIGPYPPPLGGVSVHIARMKAYLGQKGIDHQVYALSGSGANEKSVKVIKDNKVFFLRIPFLHEEILHFHSSHIGTKILMGLYPFFGKRVVLTIHSEHLDEQLHHSGWLFKSLLRWSLKRLDTIIAVNETIQGQLLQVGISRDSVLLLPAYVTPTADEMASDLLPIELETFFEGDGPLIVTNGTLKPLEKGDLYGFDFLIEMANQLRVTQPTLKLYMACIGFDKKCPKHVDYMHDLYAKIQRLHLGRHVFLRCVDNESFIPVLKHTDVFIRATVTDGDAMSVREALSLHVPVVASDVCERPDGVLVYRNLEMDALCEQVNQALELKKRPHDMRYKTSTCEDTLLSLYESLYFGKRGRRQHVK